MCGRVELLTDDELEEVLTAVEGWRRMRLRVRDGRAQARPGSELHVVAPTGGTGNDLTIAPFTWGFSFPDSKRLVFNTRIESALGGARMWADAIRDGRCVLPVATFFEPHVRETAANPRTGRPVKRQYGFASPDGEPLLLASVAQDGRLSVVTTEPNASVTPIHPRMPLVLRFEEVHAWLDGDFDGLAERPRPDLAVRSEDDGRRDGPEQLSLF